MKQSLREKKVKNRRFFDRLSTVIMALLAVAMVISLAVLAKKFTVASNTGDYEGEIVDRWADYAEFSQGARARLALVVESRDGKRFTVRVDSNVYESARVGMGIKSRNGQVV